MNQEKIGKLIAKMRKQKDLTQRELGEMVGVGFRAVSKWERGQTMPDISIINELSTILGITSDELLKGELSAKVDKQETQTTNIDSEPNKKSNKRKLLFIPIIVIAIIVIILLVNKNKHEEYLIKTINPNDYLVEGILYVEDDNLIIKISKIEFQDYSFFQKPIKNYEYNVLLDDNFVFGYGISDEYKNLNSKMTINEFFEDFKINYNDYNNHNIKLSNESVLEIDFSFTDLSNNEVKKSVKTILVNK